MISCARRSGRIHGEQRRSAWPALTIGGKENAHVDGEQVVALALAAVLGCECFGRDQHLAALGLRYLPSIVLLSVHFSVLKFNYRI